VLAAGASTVDGADYTDAADIGRSLEVATDPGALCAFEDARALTDAATM
jgi:hypothetical protein